MQLYFQDPFFNSCKKSFKKRVFAGRILKQNYINVQLHLYNYHLHRLQLNAFMQQDFLLPSDIFVFVDVQYCSDNSHSNKKFKPPNILFLEVANSNSDRIIIFVSHKDFQVLPGKRTKSNSQCKCAVILCNIFKYRNEGNKTPP